MRETRPVKVYFDTVSNSSQSTKLDIPVDSPARFIPQSFCRNLNRPYRPELGVFIHNEGVNEDDDQKVEWIHPETRLSSALLSDHLTIFVVRPIISRQLQSSCDYDHHPTIRLCGSFGNPDRFQRDFSITRSSQVSRIPGCLCQSLDLPCSADLSTFAEVSPGNWREIRPDLTITSLGWIDGQRVLVKQMPTEVRLTVHVEELSVNPKSIRLSRNARVRDIAKRVHSQARFAYGWDKHNKKYIPLPLSASVFQIDERVRDAVLVTRRELALFISVKCKKWPGTTVVTLDCNAVMSVKQLAERFIFGIDEEEDAKFDVWRENQSGEKLKLDATLTEAGIADKDVVVVRVSSIAEEERAKQLMDTLKFGMMKGVRRG